MVPLTSKEIQTAITDIAKGVWDTWEQDEDGKSIQFGTWGGMCDEVAVQVKSWFRKKGFDARAIAARFPSGACHVWVAFAVPSGKNKGVWEVDYPWTNYEIHLGDNHWKRKASAIWDAARAKLHKKFSDPTKIQGYSLHETRASVLCPLAVRGTAYQSLTRLYQATARPANRVTALCAGKPLSRMVIYFDQPDLSVEAHYYQTDAKAVYGVADLSALPGSPAAIRVDLLGTASAAPPPGKGGAYSHAVLVHTNSLEEKRDIFYVSAEDLSQKIPAQEFHAHVGAGIADAGVATGAFFKVEVASPVLPASAVEPLAYFQENSVVLPSRAGGLHKEEAASAQRNPAVRKFLAAFDAINHSLEKGRELSRGLWSLDNEIRVLIANTPPYRRNAVWMDKGFFDGATPGKNRRVMTYSRAATRKKDGLVKVVIAGPINVLNLGTEVILPPGLRFFSGGNKRRMTFSVARN